MIRWRFQNEGFGPGHSQDPALCCEHLAVSNLDASSRPFAQTFKPFDEPIHFLEGIVMHR